MKASRACAWASLLLGLFAAARPTCAGTTHVVSPSGDDRAEGTVQSPWRTVENALERLGEGDTLLLRGGRYTLSRQARIHVLGSPDAWTIVTSYPGERADLDASAITQFKALTPSLEEHTNNGALQIEQSAYVSVRNLRILRSADAGVTVRDSSHVDILNTTTCTTYSSGIAVWDTLHAGEATRDIRIIGNWVHRATTRQARAEDPTPAQELPQEAISIAGAVGFEVADNHVSDGEKEGIDVKETSRNGRVHHNVVHGMGRQGLYVDSWFGRLEDVEIDNNVVLDNKGAGISVSTENGEVTRDIRIHHNLIAGNAGSGVHFTRFAKNGSREDISVYNNTIARNGYGPADMDRRFHWITGGILLSSGSLRDVSIYANIVAENEGFQIGCGSDLCPVRSRIADDLAAKRVNIFGNRVFDSHPDGDPVMNDFPPTAVLAYPGQQANTERPHFLAPELQDFSLAPSSAGVYSLEGAFTGPRRPDFWWQRRLQQDRDDPCP